MKSISSSQRCTSTDVSISFVIIVLNGMPWIKLVLENLYPYAHEIIIVEGAVANCLFAANPDGSSKDGTVEAIRDFPDPEGKILLIQGSWPEKCEMQNKALEQVTGNYVWLVDADELYRHRDIEATIRMLRDHPDITQVNFIPDNFWKGFNYIFVSPRFFKKECECRRVFKYVPGSKFSTHRPPTLYWPGFHVSTEQQKLVDGLTTRYAGILFYHYSYVFDFQALQKMRLYQRYGWDKMWHLDFRDWYENFYKRWTPENAPKLETKYPVWTGDPNSYTVPFPGRHPEVVEKYLAGHSNLTGRPVIPDIPMCHVIRAVQEVLYLFLLESHLLALETGTIRSHEQCEGTRYIAQSLGKRGRLLSVDSSEDSIRITRDICRNVSNVQWIQSDSVAFLEATPDNRYHFVLLDSVNDAEHIFHEFALVAPMLVEGGMLMVDDAGLQPDGRGFDGSAAQKGRKVWAFLRAVKAEYGVVEAPGGYGTQLKIPFTKSNRQKILAGLAHVSAPSVAHHPKVAAHYVFEGTEVGTTSDFSGAIRKIFAAERLRHVIETGTYLGTGTTQTIASALSDLGQPAAEFFTIEVNPANYRQALVNLSRKRLLGQVRPLLGLSVPRSLLPDLAEIKKAAIDEIADMDIFVDHEEGGRAANYYEETNFPGLPDDLLGLCLAEFGNKPDFVLLDSGGHMRPLHGICK